MTALEKPVGPLAKMRRIILGDGGGVTHKDLESELVRVKMSDYLPWVSFDQDRQAFQTLDNRHGYIWEITPLTFLGGRDLKQLETFLSIAWPKRTIMQFILYPDHNIDGFLEDYKNTKTRKDPLSQKSVQEYAKFLKEGTKGVKAFHGIPVRNFRGFLCIKTKEPLPDDVISIAEETLQGAHLAPRRWGQGDLVAWARQFFNDPYAPPNGRCDSLIPLRKQIINAETKIEFHGHNGPFELGRRYGRVLTPKVNAKTIDAFTSNTLIGGVMGPSEDNDQITSPFLLSLNIVYEDIKTSIHQKASATMAQKATGSFAKAIQRRTEEFSWALDQLEQERFMTIIPSLVVFGDTEEDTIDNVSRARRIWESKEFQMQEESTLEKPMLIASLPFGLYDIDKNIQLLDRHFYAPQSTVARFLPVQGDFQGASRPVLAFVGRKGQAVGIDVYDKRAHNHNFLIAAGSGAGKSYSLNNICSNYYSAGSLVRVVDIGYSFEKLARTVGGRFMDFGKERVVINPFTSQSKDADDLASDLVATANIIAEMAYSASRQPLHETEWTLIKEAVRWAAETGDVENGIDTVQRYLRRYPEDAVDKPEFSGAIDKAHELAFNLYDFTSKGNFGQYFNGKSTFNIANDDFVVLELEKLNSQKELFNVVIMQVMNSVTQDLYLSDRSQERFILFEEAWQYFSDTSGTGNRLGALIEEGYRRARKYGGSFGIVTQSPLDLLKFGPVGTVIKNNAAFKFFLECEDYKKAVDQGVLDYQGLAVDLLTSIRANKPKYSEIFFETPLGKGVGRLAVDPWNHWVATSSHEDVAAFNTLIKQGIPPVEAISKLSGVPI